MAAKKGAKPTSKKKADELTPKERRFVDEYLIDLNATQAAARAGYNPRRAKQTGYELLRRPRVAAAITKAATQRSERVLGEADDVLRELFALGCSRLTDWMSWDVDEKGAIKNVRVKASAMLAPETVASIKELRIRADGSVDLKTHAKDPALALLAKHFGLVNDRVEHSGPGGGPIPVTAQSSLESKLKGLRERLAG